jgi:hypothetical protein
LKRNKNVHVKEEWVKQCLQFLQNQQDITAIPRQQLVEELYKQFLVSDYTQTGTGRLPPDLASQHKTTITGPVIVQVGFVVWLD